MRILLIITAILCIFLLVGCGQREKIVQPIVQTPGVEDNVVEDETPEETAAETTETTVTEQEEPAQTEETDIGITQEDLDKLKSDIEGMNFEDIDEISE